jgi:drug/metabolite transporter (DMT)-like permease
MELWFWASVLAMLLAGFSNFYFKQAAVRGYDPAAFSLLGGLWSVLFAVLLLAVETTSILSFGFLLLLPMLNGAVIVATTNIFKLKALQHIDATIYFPLFKLLSPIVAICAGVALFGERFTLMQWLGIGLGLSVHILLISRAEKARQNNLFAGLLLVLLTSITSATSAILVKYVVDEGMTPSIVMFMMSIGLCIGSVAPILYTSRFQGIYHIFSGGFSRELVVSAGMRSALICGTVFLTTYAFAVGGTLSMVQTILSFYVVITVVLAIVYYGEHWNLRKAFAIALSLLALAFFH